MKQLKGERAFNVIVSVLLIIIAVVTLYPIWFVLIASISSPVAIGAGEVLLLPKGINFKGYEMLFEDKNIWIGYRNSIIYTAAATVLDLIVTIPCAYALSRKTLPYRRILMLLFTITMYFSGGTIPKYLLINSLGMINTPWSLIIPGCVNVFNLIVARSFFESSIPESLFDAARIDGSGYTRFFAQIVIPLSPAILAIIALYCIQAHWNGYLAATMYIYNPKLKTLQQIIRSITANLDSSLAESATTEELIYAAQKTQLLKYSVVVVSALPLILIYPFVQKFFVKGVMVGAVKG